MEIFDSLPVFQYGALEPSALTFSDELRKICEESACGGYNTSWACPPAVGTVEECRKRCLSFEHAILFSGRQELEDSFDFEGMREGHRKFKELCDTVYEAVKEKYPRHLLLSNEGCMRCRKCTYPDAPCRFPEKLFPSLEGFGFNVGELAKAAGMDYYKPETVTYFGMFLF